MSSKTELVYSNDLCSAFLAAIIKSFSEHHPDGLLGRTAIQKLTYFAKVLGVPIPCSFGIYTYGPYSDKVTFAMEAMLADEVVVDHSVRPKYSVYRPGPMTGVLLDLFADEIGPYEAKINSVVDGLGAFKPQDLELIATLHFIARRQSRITRTKPLKTNVLREFKLIKKGKFPDEEIKAWYDALVQAGLINA